MLLFFTFLSAFLIEALGTIVSVIGLSALFGSNPIIIALAVSLDIAKLVTVSLVYQHWSTLGRIMRVYACSAAAITMVITSAGAAGYLSAQFSTAVLGAQEGALKVDVLKKEQAKLEDRKKQIDASIAGLPERYTANQRIRLIAQFREEQKQVTARLAELDRALPELQVSQLGVEAKAGPILYISKAFDVPVEQAVKWVILLIIFVFDPLAVFLIVAGNFLLAKRRASTKPLEQTIQPVTPVVPVTVPAVSPPPKIELPAEVPTGILDEEQRRAADRAFNTEYANQRSNEEITLSSLVPSSLARVKPDPATITSTDSAPSQTVSSYYQSRS